MRQNVFENELPKAKIKVCKLAGIPHIWSQLCKDQLVSISLLGWLPLLLKQATFSHFSGRKGPTCLWQMGSWRHTVWVCKYSFSLKLKESEIFPHSFNFTQRMMARGYRWPSWLRAGSLSDLPHINLGWLDCKRINMPFLP